MKRRRTCIPGFRHDYAGARAAEPTVSAPELDPATIRIGCPEDAERAFGTGSAMHEWARSWFREQRGAGPIEIARKPRE